MTIRPSARKTVIIVSSAVALFYLAYRTVFTLNLTTPYAVFASLFLLVGEIYGVMNMLLYFVQVWDTSEPPQKPLPSEVRTVDVFVPTYNEDVEILRTTLLACVRMDYPHKTYLCDDGGTDARVNDPEKGPGARKRQDVLKALCAEVGAIYMTRPRNEHAKAGNLNHAFGKTDGEFIIIFDADHVPDAHFISRLIGYFEDEKLGFVQTPHAFYNFESFQARLNHAKGSYWEEGQLFYHVIQPGRNRWNAPIFAGSAALFRRKALEEVGYIAVETITEDMHTGLRMHSRGWKSLGISERMISGQAAQDVTTFHSQRLRWGEGNLSVLAYDNPLTMKGLKWGQRLCYFATMINWCGGVFKLPIYLTPLLMLFTGVPPVKEFTWPLAVLMAAYMLCSILGVAYTGNGYGSAWYSELFTMASFWTQVRATMRAIFWRKFQQFVVTMKRGRQAKSIWPFVRPQLVLIFVSILALVWAWSRVFLGVSDDVFKPVLASFWVGFHMLLAYLVVRRALWPDDRRFSTRHIVHLPIAYEACGPDGTVCGVGVTADLNDGGVGFVAYERLPDGVPLQLTIHGAGEVVCCAGAVKSVRNLTPDRSAPPGAPTGYRYGVAFENLTDVEKDALNRLCLQYAVPRLYAFYGQEHRRMDAAVRSQWGRLFHRRSTVRHGFHLPVHIRLHPEGPMLPAATEDVSSRALALVVEEDVPAGAECPFTLTTPLGVVKGKGRVLRTVPRSYSSRPFYLAVIEFVDFEPGGRVTLEKLLGRSVSDPLRPVLSPARLPMPVPVNKPLTVGLVAAAVLIAAELGTFRWVYNDDFFLQNVAALDRPLTPDEGDHVTRIYAATMRETYPSTDRLVLLGRSLQHMGRSAELAEVTKLLGPRDRHNMGLQVALAAAYDERGQYDQAEDEYLKLERSLDAGAIPESRREELMAGAAHCAVHAGRTDLAAGRYRDLLARFPDNAIYRNEFAGVLLNAGRLDDAGALYDGGTPDYEGRVLLVMIRTQAKDWPGAEREARALLRDNPGDAAAEGLLADVLNLRGDYRQARSIYERLLKSNAADLKLAIQLAHTSLWAKNYQEALERFQAIADQGALDDPETLRKFPDLRRSYVTAAANTPDEQGIGKQTVLRLADAALTDKGADAAYLAQLGWVLHRVEAFEQSSAVLQRAVDLDPNDGGTRRQLAGVLVAMGKADDALRLLQGHENGLDAHIMMADAYAAAKDFAGAEHECRDLLKDHPDDMGLRLRLANILSWNGRYSEAIEAFEDLVKKDPKNHEYAVRLAETTLWSGDCAHALERYQALLTADFDRPGLWWGFVDAAAGAGALTDAEVRVALAIADKTRAGEHKSDRVAEAFRKQGKELAEAPYLTRLAWVMQQHAKDPARAGALLDMALALRPADPSARRELAGVLAAAGRYKDALAMYEGLTLTWQDHVALARIDAAADDFDNAVSQCREALAAQPLDKDAQRLLADVLSWKGEYRESMALFSQLVKAFPDDRDARRRQAEVTLWAGDAAGALSLFQAALADEPDRPDLRRGFLEAVGKAERLTPEQAARAKELATGPIAPEPQNVELMARAAWVLFRHLDQMDAGRDLAQSAAAVPSQDAAALTRLGWVLYEIGDKEDSHKVLARAVGLQPRPVAVRKELAGVLTAAGMFAESRTLLQGLVKDDPKDAALQADLARAALWAGDPAAAVSQLQDVLEADFQQPALWRTYVDAAAAVPQLTAAQTKLALRIADQAVQARATDEQAAFLSRLAWVLHREGEKGRAGELLDRAVALDPKDPKTRRELAGVLTAAGKNDAGLKLYTGLTLDLEDRFQLVVLYSAARRFPEAEKQCRAILEEKPEDGRAHRWLADVLLWGNQYAAAATEYERLLAADFEQPTLWPSYVEAAARSPALTPDQTKLAARIIDCAGEHGQDAVYLAREALLLYRHVEQKAALPALAGRTAGLMASPSPAAGWLGAAADAADRARRTRARTLLARAFALRPQDPTQLARLSYTAYQMDEIPSAAEALDAAIALRPADPAIRRELGDCLVATGRLAEALPWFEELAANRPNDAELQTRLALVTVWSGAYARGLERITPLLTEDFRQPELWATFVDAAAGAPSMTEAQVDLALKIAKEPAPVQGEDAQTLYLSRLAWALLHEGQRTKTETWQTDADALLDQALKHAAREPATRRELAGVLGAARRFNEALPIYEDLARLYPQDAELRVRLAELTLWSGAHGRAVARFEELLQTDETNPRLWRGFVDAAAGAPALTPSQAKLALRLAEKPPEFADADEEAAYRGRLAWALLRESDKDTVDDRSTRARALLDRAVALQPRDPKARRELAGVLAAAGMADAGIGMYDGLTLTTDDRLQLIGQYAAAKRFPEAQEQCRAVLKEKPDDPAARRWLAQTTLWGGDAASALPQLEALLKENFEQPDLWASYVDAAAAIPGLKPPQLDLAVRIAGRGAAGRPEAVAFLCRLAWVLVREGKASGDDTLLKRAGPLLDQALALRPAKPEERKELAGVLAAVGRSKQALNLVNGLVADSPADLSLRIALFCAEKDFASAEKEARRLVALSPDDFEARYQLANVLSWNKKYDEASALFTDLEEAKPDDPRLPTRLAEVALWSGQYDIALDRYHRLLQTNWNQPSLWPGYVDAASAAKAVPADPHKETVLRIYEKLSAAPGQDAAFLGRFAWVLRRLDEPKKSVALLRGAVGLDPKSRELRRQLADALSAAGEYDEAEKQYRVLLSGSH